MVPWPHAPRTPWRPNFPEIMAQAGYREMTSHFLYRSAKDGIGSQSALALVLGLMADDAVAAIAKAISGTRPLVVAVHAEEASGRNRIPLAYAEILARLLRLETDPEIVQATVANHTNAPSIFHRLVSPPLFSGPVRPGVDYLIVDDTCTAGGTLANLKGFIEANGGRVVAASVVALAQPSRRCDIGLDAVTLRRLERRHPGLSRYWNEAFGYGTDCLTEGEAGHLLRASSVDWIRDRLAAARRDLDVS